MFATLVVSYSFPVSFNFNLLYTKCEILISRILIEPVFCVKCGHWVYGIYSNIKIVTTSLAMHFVCSRCMEEMVDSIKNLCDEVKTVYRFCYVGDRLNAYGGCEAAVTASKRIVRWDSGNVESHYLGIGFH